MGKDKSTIEETNTGRITIEDKTFLNKLLAGGAFIKGRKYLDNFFAPLPPTSALTHSRRYAIVGLSKIVYLAIGGTNMLKHFKVIIEHEIEGGYSLHVPAFPGCASQSETIKEGIVNIKEAIELYIWSLKDDGLPIPKSDVEVELREVEVSV